MRSWLSVLITDAESKKVFDIPIAPSLYSLSNKMDNSLLAVRDINHKYIVVAWKDITEEAVEPIAWINGTGLTEKFAYEKMSVKRGSLKDISDKKAFLISMLNEHPEGIVIYENTKGKDKQHAVLLTDYTNEKFYSADPDRNSDRPKGRIALTDTYIAELCGKKENQDIDPDIIINSLGAYWYIEK